MARPIILDCDTGTDDAVAIMLAALHPDLELMAVTTVWGNEALTQTTENTVRVLHHVGRADVPVYRGLGDRQSGSSHAPGTRASTGPNPLSLRSLPSSVTSAREQPAVEWLVDTLRTARTPVTLVATGPLTNIAAAVARSPHLVDAVDEMIIMGGSDAVATIETNTRHDPRAAQRVFSAGFARLVLIPLDATYDAVLDHAQCRILSSFGTPAATATAAFARDRIAAYAETRQFGGRCAPIHDALTVAYLIRPDVVALRPARVQVETSGRTVMNLDGGRGRQHNAQVAFQADRSVFFDVIQATLGGQTSPPGFIA